MASNYPTSLDSFANPSSTDAMDSVSVPHATQHSDLNDAVEALQAKVGADSSAVTSSHDYKIADHASRITALEGATAGIAIFNETQSAGTSGGTFTSGSYVKRTLNTTVVNTITGASIAASVITLPAGTYEVHATAPAYDVDRHKMRIRDTTNSTTLAIGNPLIATSGTDVSNQSSVMGSFTLAGSANIEVQHRCGTTRAANGLGVEGGFGDDEVYAQITIRAL